MNARRALRSRLIIVTVFLVSICLSGVLTAHANFPDVEGTRYERPVEVLGRLGLITGFADGSFRPHAQVTRAEFAALAVRARGLETASKFVAGATPYPDVPAQHWASGHVNLATDYQLIRGYPDGTFRPAESVSYAEALAIIVRLLDCDRFVSGRWPDNYLAAAAALGITSGQTVPSARPATRADVALFIERALTVPIGQSPGSAAPVGASTLLDLNPAVTAQTGVVSDVWTRPESPLSRQQISLFAGGREHIMRLDDPRVTATDLLGREIRAWSQTGDILAFSRRAPDSASVSGDIRQVAIADGVIEFITVASGRYPVRADAVMYRNHRRQTNANQRADQWLSGTVRMVLDAGGMAVWVEAVTFDGSWVVGESDSHRRTLTVTDSSGIPRRINLNDYRTVTCFVNGQVLSPFSLSRGTVVHHFSTGQERLHIEARSEVRELVCEAVFPHEFTPVLRLGGRDYPVAGATLSLDGSHTVEPVSPPSLARLLHRPVRVHIDPSGRVRHLSADIIGPPGDPWVGILSETPIQNSGGSVLLAIATEDGRYVRRWAQAIPGGGNPAHLLAGSLVQVSRRTDTLADRVEELGTGPEFELSASISRSADRMLWNGSRWTRLAPGAVVFAKDTTPYALHPAALWGLTGTGGSARAFQSTEAAVSVLVLDKLGPVSGEAGIVLAPARDSRLWVLTVRGPVGVDLPASVRALSGRNSGAQSAAADSLRPGDFVTINGGAVTEPAALFEGTAVKFNGVDPNGVLRHGTGAQTGYLLTDPATVVIDPSGIGGRRGLDDIPAGTRLQVYDLDRDGLVDYIVVIVRD